jgi:hypothetical protein
VRILFTNGRLENYSGTETVVRDLTVELARRGHTPMVYSPVCGTVAAHIRQSGIEVVDRLDELSAPPDLIHAQHHPAAIEALLHFPLAPAIYVCHGVGPYLETPFYFPRFLRYVGVDERCRKGLLATAGIPAERVQVMLNAVDLQRFPARAPLPQRPRRALLFSNGTEHLPAVRRACRRAGLQLDVIGHAAGNTTPDPGPRLGQYDIVFAKARGALEAMAVGTAVVLCDFAGSGPMVTTQNFDELRPMNFGIAKLTGPLHADALCWEIGRYNAADAQLVSARVRAEADLRAAVERWLELYAEVIAEFRQAGRDCVSEFRAVGDYLERWSYGERKQWELQQLGRLEKTPVIGKLAKRLVWKLVRDVF